MSAFIRRLFVVAVSLAALPALAANVVTVQTVDAEPGDTSVRVDVHAHNEVELLEYFNLLIFDETRLAYVDLVADRGGFWYGYYPTRVEGDHVYVHGWAVDYPDCIDPVAGDPGPPLFHLLFDVLPDAPEGLAALPFGSEGAFDGHWNDCSGYSVTPAPTYHDGGVQVEPTTGVDDGRAVAVAPRAYPNPAAGSTRISFVLPASGRTEI
ncbi:hypothetical protein KKG45_07085, partial [bacterium]|nr:hypothetical protein [bacterium]